MENDTYFKYFGYGHSGSTTKKFNFKEWMANKAGSKSNQNLETPCSKSEQTKKTPTKPGVALEKLKLPVSSPSFYPNKGNTEADESKCKETQSSIFPLNENNYNNLDLSRESQKSNKTNFDNSVDENTKNSLKITDRNVESIQKFSFQKKTSIKLSLKNINLSESKTDVIDLLNSSSEKSIQGLNDSKTTKQTQEKFNISNIFREKTSQNSSHNSTSNDKASIIEDTLRASKSDYMDDEEFERLFGQTDSPITTSTQEKVTNLGDYLDDDINLDEIDWDSEIPIIKKTDSEEAADLLDGVDISDFVETDHQSTNFNNRVDNSEEFVGDYPHSSVMLEVLRTRFGLRTFRPHQREICNASLTGHDIFVLMPTGGGKSLCYQLPATLTPGVTIVISPLRSLISDQVDKLNALDIPAGHLCADQTKTETEAIISKLYLREPEIKLLFLTPEKISASKHCSDILDYLYARDKLSRFIIDEAHCLSQWGHDFRPDYKQLSLLRQKYPKVAIACFTATATKQVECDVSNILKLRNVKLFIRSFNRPNIKYKVITKSKANVIDEIAALIRKKFAKQSGIVYCLSRDDCERCAEYLKKSGVPAMPYHAGLSSKIRDAVQRQWMQDRFNVIVGTIAFGMGIDKPDVRFVIHNSIPKSVEAFYQESGRAGRDGETSHSYLFYSYNDVKRLQRIMMLEKSNKKALDGHFEALKQMVAYCENHVDCRRYLQLIHLGEQFDRRICMKNKETTCDNCEQSKSFASVDVTQHAKDLCQLIYDFTLKGDKVTLAQIADVYKGSKAKKLIEKGHDKHAFYGKGAALNRLDVQRILKQLLMKNILGERCEYAAGFPVVYINKGSDYKALNAPNFKLNITVGENSNEASTSKNILKSTKSSTPESPIPSTSKTPNQTVTLSKHELSQIRVRCHEELLEECRRLALERNMNLSAVMNLSAIKKMSDLLPKTRDEMLKVQHVTAANYEKYGEFFLKITAKYAAEMDKLTVPKIVPAKPMRNANDEDDFWYSSPSTSANNSFKSKGKQGSKRKSSGGYKRGGGKRFKKSRTPSKRGGKSKKSGLGTMPIPRMN